MTLSVLSRPLSCALSSRTPCHILTVNPPGQTLTQEADPADRADTQAPHPGQLKCPCPRARLKFTHRQLPQRCHCIRPHDWQVKLAHPIAKRHGPNFSNIKTDSDRKEGMKINLQVIFSTPPAVLGHCPVSPPVLSPSGSALGLRVYFNLWLTHSSRVSQRDLRGGKLTRALHRRLFFSPTFSLSLAAVYFCVL